MRMCAACRKRHPKAEMVRIALDQDSSLSVDAGGTLRGRGVNVCPDVQCLEKAFSIKAFDRVWSGVQQKSDMNNLRTAFDELLKARAFRGGKQTVTYRVEKDKAEAHVGHRVTRAE